ncbi:MAG: GNAT family N-acetyltransferase [Lachnospiraceae bacterium]|nr:GNAT family N-acetyltransferase [Lachnospiraceae bacterium]
MGPLQPLENCYRIDCKEEGVSMSKLTTKQFQILTDINMAWDFMVEVYNEAGGKGTETTAAPFFEYAITSSWMNKDYLHLCRFWLDGDTIVGFVFYENPVTHLRFILRPGYEELAEEMIAYAIDVFPDMNQEKEFVFSEDQTALIEAVEKRGYKLTYKNLEYRLNMTSAALDYTLPNGFHFVEPDDVEPLKLARCCWKGFNEWELGPFENWDIPDHTTDWNPHKSYTGVENNAMAPPPHSTYEHAIVIANEEGEYVCYSGMWWISENKLAYMEPLCTIPEYQHRGLAAAALSQHYKKFKAMGGKYLTGGGNDFYRKIGYDTEVYTLVYKKV